MKKKSKDTVDVKGGQVKVFKSEVAKPVTKKVAVVADKVVTKGTTKYSADYSLIDQTIDEIKKASRAVCSNHYATNNVYIILQDALKRVTLAEK